MDTVFHKLSKDEYALLKDSIPQITVLIAGADGKISQSETNWAEKVANIRSYSEPEEYRKFYEEVGQDFHDRLEKLISELPQGVEERGQMIARTLSGLNPILKKLEPKHAAHIYGELKSFAKHVARASGGFLTFWSISAEEKRWIDLPMLEVFEWHDEDDQHHD
jgi:uncharacterized protein YydD (DUF2326 family)